MNKCLCWIVAISAFVAVFSAQAQTDIMSIASSTDGQGTYTITFTHTNYPCHWHVTDYSTGSGFFLNDFYETNLIVPDGWVQQRYNDGWVLWTYTNGEYELVDTSVTFTVQTAWTNWALYTNSHFTTEYRRGIFMGCASCLSGMPFGCAAGFQWIDYTGPAIPCMKGMMPDVTCAVMTLCDTYGSSVAVERASSPDAEAWDLVTNIPVVVGCTNVNVPYAESDAPVFLRFRSY